jgi:2-desacetyl-2-hydroxyethyl bacteriochlorophyllide A dehydrogenase
MKAAVFTGKGKIEIRDIKLREPEADEVMIDVEYCGICGTDIHIYHGSSGSVEVAPPVVLGHEYSGTVYKTGKDVTRFHVGQRVVVDPNLSCNTCKFCLDGKRHLCENLVGIGTAADGGFSEYTYVKQELVYAIPDNVSFEQAAFAEPISCALHGIDLCNIEQGKNVAIIGGGTIGMIMLQLAKNAGASNLIMIEPVEKKRTLAKKLGADICIDPISMDVKSELEKGGVRNIDYVIECVGKAQTVEMSVSIAGKGATVMWFGLTEADKASRIFQYEVFLKELTLKASFINPHTMQRSIELLRKDKIDVSFLIAKVIKLDDLRTVFEDEELLKQGKILVKAE